VIAAAAVAGVPAVNGTPLKVYFASSAARSTVSLGFVHIREIHSS